MEYTCYYQQLDAIKAMMLEYPQKRKTQLSEIYIFELSLQDSSRMMTGIARSIEEIICNVSKRKGDHRI